MERGPHERGPQAPYADEWLHRLDRSYEFQRAARQPYHTAAGSFAASPLLPPPPLHHAGREALRVAMPVESVTLSRLVMVVAFFAVSAFLSAVDVQELGTGLELLGGHVRATGRLSRRLGGQYDGMAPEHSSGALLRTHVFDHVPSVDHQQLGLVVDPHPAAVALARRTNSFPGEGATPAMLRRGSHTPLPPQSTGKTEAEEEAPDARVDPAYDHSGVQQPTQQQQQQQQREEAEAPDERSVADASAERRQEDISADDMYGMSVATLSRAGACQARRLNEGPWLNIRHKVEQAVTSGVRLWMELEQSQSEEYPGAAAVRAKEVARGTLAMSGSMIWPSERQKGSTIDLSPLPKLFVFAANSSFGAAPAYEQSLQALGWDYYMFGGELARQYPGACVRARSLEILCSVLHEQQVVVATDGADVLALLGPEDFVAKYQHTQERYSVVGRTPKLFFGAKARPTTGPWQYLYPPGLLLHSREQDENGHSTLTVRSADLPRNTLGKEGMYLLVEQTDASTPGNGQWHDVGTLRREGKASMCGNAQELNMCQGRWDQSTRALASRYDVVRSPQSAQWQYVHMDAAFVAGTAQQLGRMLHEIMLRRGEDDSLLFEEYWRLNNGSVTLDYNGELFATTQAFPAAGRADADGWKWVCNVEQVEVARVLHFCHNLLHTCGVFMRTAGTGGVHWQCAAQTYALWQKTSSCGGRATAAAEVLRALPGSTEWTHTNVKARATFRSFVQPADHRTQQRTEEPRADEERVQPDYQHGE